MVPYGSQEQKRFQSRAMWCLNVLFIIVVYVVIRTHIFVLLVRGLYGTSRILGTSDSRLRLISYSSFARLWNRPRSLASNSLVHLGRARVSDHNTPSSPCSLAMELVLIRLSYFDHNLSQCSCASRRRGVFITVQIHAMK